MADLFDEMAREDEERRKRGRDVFDDLAAETEPRPAAQSMPPATPEPKPSIGQRVAKRAREVVTGGEVVPAQPIAVERDITGRPRPTGSARGVRNPDGSVAQVSPYTIRVTAPTEAAARREAATKVGPIVGAMMMRREAQRGTLKPSVPPTPEQVAKTQMPRTGAEATFTPEAEAATREALVRRSQAGDANARAVLNNMDRIEAQKNKGVIGKMNVLGLGEDNAAKYDRVVLPQVVASQVEELGMGRVSLADPSLSDGELAAEVGGFALEQAGLGVAGRLAAAGAKAAQAVSQGRGVATALRAGRAASSAVARGESLAARAARTVAPEDAAAQYVLREAVEGSGVGALRDYRTAPGYGMERGEAVEQGLAMGAAMGPAAAGVFKGVGAALGKTGRSFKSVAEGLREAPVTNTMDAVATGVSDLARTVADVAQGGATPTRYGMGAQTVDAIGRRQALGEVMGATREGMARDTRMTELARLLGEERDARALGEEMGDTREAREAARDAEAATASGGASVLARIREAAARQAQEASVGTDAEVSARNVEAERDTTRQAAQASRDAVLSAQAAKADAEAAAQAEAQAEQGMTVMQRLMARRLNGPAGKAVGAAALGAAASQADSEDEQEALGLAGVALMGTIRPGDDVASEALRNAKRSKVALRTHIEAPSAVPLGRRSRMSSDAAANFIPGDVSEQLAEFNAGKAPQSVLDMVPATRDPNETRRLSDVARATPGSGTWRGEDMANSNVRYGTLLTAGRDADVRQFDAAGKAISQFQRQAGFFREHITPEGTHTGFAIDAGRALTPEEYRAVADALFAQGFGGTTRLSENGRHLVTVSDQLNPQDRARFNAEAPRVLKAIREAVLGATNSEPRVKPYAVDTNYIAFNVRNGKNADISAQSTIRKAGGRLTATDVGESQFARTMVQPRMEQLGALYEKVVQGDPVTVRPKLVDGMPVSAVKVGREVATGRNHMEAVAQLSAPASRRMARGQAGYLMDDGSFMDRDEFLASLEYHADADMRALAVLLRETKTPPRSEDIKALLRNPARLIDRARTIAKKNPRARQVLAGPWGKAILTLAGATGLGAMVDEENRDEVALAGLALAGTTGRAADEAITVPRLTTRMRMVIERLPKSWDEARPASEWMQRLANDPAITKAEYEDVLLPTLRGEGRMSSREPLQTEFTRGDILQTLDERGLPSRAENRILDAEPRDFREEAAEEAENEWDSLAFLADEAHGEFRASRDKLATALDDLIPGKGLGDAVADMEHGRFADDYTTVEGFLDDLGLDRREEWADLTDDERRQVSVAFRDALDYAQDTLNARYDAENFNRWDFIDQRTRELEEEQRDIGGGDAANFSTYQRVNPSAPYRESLLVDSTLDRVPENHWNDGQYSQNSMVDSVVSHARTEDYGDARMVIEKQSDYAQRSASEFRREVGEVDEPTMAKARQALADAEAEHATVREESQRAFEAVRDITAEAEEVARRVFAENGLDPDGSVVSLRWLRDYLVPSNGGIVPRHLNFDEALNDLRQSYVSLREYLDRALREPSEHDAVMAALDRDEDIPAQVKADMPEMFRRRFIEARQKATLARLLHRNADEFRAFRDERARPLVYADVNLKPEFARTESALIRAQRTLDGYENGILNPDGGASWSAWADRIGNTMSMVAIEARNAMLDGKRWLVFPSAEDRMARANLDETPAFNEYEDRIPKAIKRIQAALGLKATGPIDFTDEIAKRGGAMVAGKAKAIDLHEWARAAAKVGGLPMMTPLLMVAGGAALTEAEAQAPQDSERVRRNTQAVNADTMLAMGASALAAAVAGRRLLREGWRRVFQTVTEGGLRGPAAVAALGAAFKAMDGVPFPGSDDDLLLEDTTDKLGSAALALAALQTVGPRPFAEAVRRAGRGLGKVMPSLASYIDVRTTLPTEVIRALDEYHGEVGKGLAARGRVEAAAQGTTPAARRAATDLFTGEDWGETFSAADTKQAMAMLGKVADELGDISDMKLGEGIITDEQYLASGERSFLTRLYAKHEARRVGKVGAPPTGSGKAIRITPEKSRELDAPVRQAERALAEAQKAGNPNDVAAAQQALDAARTENIRVRKSLGEVRDFAYRAGVQAQKAHLQKASKLLFETLRLTPEAMDDTYLRLADEVETAKLLHEHAIATGAPAQDIADARAMLALARADLDRYAKPFESQIFQLGDYVRLPQSDGLGPLSGAVVRKDVYLAVNGMPDIPGIRSLLTWWKQSKTVFNPATHVGNIMSNSVMAHLAGLSMAEQAVGGWLERARDVLKDPFSATYKALADGGVLQQATEAVGLDDPAARSLYGPTYDDLLRLRLQDPTSQTAQVLQGQGILTLPERMRMRGQAGLGDATEKVAERTAGARELLGRGARWARTEYANEDNVFRAALYLHAIEKQKMTPEQALDYTRTKLVDFRSASQHSPLLKLMKNTAFPFLLYPAAALPQFASNVIQNPVAYLTLMGTMAALNDAARQQAGSVDPLWDVPDREAPSGSVLSPEVVQVPLGTGPTGGRPAIDFTRWLPLSSLVTGAAPATLAAKFDVPQVLVPSGPLTDAVSIAANRDPFTGRELVNATGEVGPLVKQLARSALPPIAAAQAPSIVQSIRRRDPVGLSQDLMATVGLRPRYYAPGEGVREAKRNAADAERQIRFDFERATSRSGSPEFSRQQAERAGDRLRRVQGKLRERLNLQSPRN